MSILALKRKLTTIEAAVGKNIRPPLQLSGLGILFELKRDPGGINRERLRGQKAANLGEFYSYLTEYVAAAKAEGLKGNGLFSEYSGDTRCSN